MENKVNKELRSQLHRLGMLILEKLRETKVIEKCDKYQIANLVEDAYQAFTISAKKDTPNKVLEIFLEHYLNTLHDLETGEIGDIYEEDEEDGEIEEIENENTEELETIIDILSEAKNKIEGIAWKTHSKRKMMN